MNSVRTNLFSITTRALQAKYAPVVCFCLLLAVYHFIFGQFFPNGNGMVGHDYSLGIPHLLAGYYWFHANGIWDIPWFTPAFCGGQPFFADPQSGYYSVGQLLTFIVDPLAATYLTTLMFATLGYWGFYVLLRRCFTVSRLPALLAAAIFMFNGFFAHRMIVGHFGYHGIMLVPWFAYFLIVPSNVERNRWSRNSAMGWAAGMVGAYWVQSGLGTLIVPAVLSAGVIVLLYFVWEVRVRPRHFFYRISLASGTMIALSASKVVAALSFLSNFPRADYLLPGYKSAVAAAEIAFLGLFVSPVDIAQRSGALLKNVQWALGRHELEYGVTAVPLLIAAMWIWRTIKAGRGKFSLGKAQISILVLVVFILFIPILLNTYTVAWNAVLKQTPLLKSASTFVRWYWVFIPFFALVPALMLERGFDIDKKAIALIGVALIVGFNLIQDRHAYLKESYSPDSVVSSYGAIRSGAMIPEIRKIGNYLRSDGSVVSGLNRNDGLSHGVSPMLCYNPIFGYALEKFPIKDLHPGPILESRNGHFNVKNPACYVYPKENDCNPGDHFREDQSDLLEKFVSYRPFAFRVSLVQKAANVLTLIGIATSALILLAVSSAWFIGRLCRRKPSFINQP